VSGIFRKIEGSLSVLMYPDDPLTASKERILQVFFLSIIKTATASETDRVLS
jgi:hypothetical protein